MAEKQKGRFGSAIFCLAVSTSESGKVDCRNIFTSFLAWGYPTSFKSWQAIVTLYDLPEGTSSISVSISKGNRKKVTLATGDIEAKKNQLGSTLIIPLIYQFKSEGFYNIHFNLIGSTQTLKVPLYIATQPWPNFTNKEKKFAKDNPTLVPPIRTNLTCMDCSRPYVFEEIIYPEFQLADGVLPFPEEESFVCESCGRKLHLKDIQGTIRRSLKTALSNAMKGGV